MRKRVVLWLHRTLMALGLLLVFTISCNAGWFDENTTFIPNGTNVYLVFNDNLTFTNITDSRGSYPHATYFEDLEGYGDLIIGNHSNADINITSDQRINVTLKDYRTNHVKLTGESVDGNKVTFTLCNLQENQGFAIYKDGSKVTEKNTGGDGCIEYSNSDWSSHTFTIIFTSDLEGGEDASSWLGTSGEEVWSSNVTLISLAVFVVISFSVLGVLLYYVRRRMM